MSSTICGNLLPGAQTELYEVKLLSEQRGEGKFQKFQRHHEHEHLCVCLWYL